MTVLEPVGHNLSNGSFSIKHITIMNFIWIWSVMCLLQFVPYRYSGSVFVETISKEESLRTRLSARIVDEVKDAAEK